MPGARTTAGPWYPTPTLVSGSLRRLSRTASSAASNTRVTIPAATVTTIWVRFVPEETTTGMVGSAAPAAELPWDSVGWEGDANLLDLGDAGIIDGSQTVNVTVSITGTANTTNKPVIVKLYAAGVFLGTSAATNLTSVNANETSITSIPVPITANKTMPEGARLQMAMWFASTNNGASAITYTLNYTAAGTAVPAGMTYTVTARRTISLVVTGAATVRRTISAYRTFTTTATATPTMSRRVIPNPLTVQVTASPRMLVQIADTVLSRMRKRLIVMFDD